MQWSIISAIVILIPMVLIDSSYFGNLAIAPWNIVKYNVFGGAGPNLYGTEPFSFYFINGFLNFNIVWVNLVFFYIVNASTALLTIVFFQVFALISPLVLLLSYLIVPAKNKSTLSLPHALSLLPLFLWLAVFLLQPHKEER